MLKFIFEIALLTLEFIICASQEDFSDVGGFLPCDHELWLSINLITYNYEMQKLIYRCPPPKVSFATKFSEYSLNLSLISTYGMFIELSASSTDLQADHFKGISIEQLDLHYVNGPSGHPKENFLEPLETLKVISVTRTTLPPLPASSKIRNATFERGSSSGIFGGCEELRVLNLIRWEVSEDRWLASCPKLTYLSMEQMPEDVVGKTVLGAKFLRYLRVADCGLYNLPEDFFNDLLNLETLDLSTNQLDYPDLKITLPSLNTFIMKNNKLNKDELFVDLLQRLPVLHTLDVSHVITDLCPYLISADGQFTVRHAGLKKLILDDTGSNPTCFTKTFPSLEYLSLRDQHWSQIQFSRGLVPQKALLVDLTDNPIRYFIFNEIDYEAVREAHLTTSNKSNLIFRGTIKLDCDCQNAILLKVIRENLLQMEEANCIDLINRHPAVVSANQTECEKFSCGGCTCRRLVLDNSVTADCENADISRIPRVDGLRTLHARNNKVQLQKHDLPKTLKFLDLTENRISRIEEDVVATLFSVKDRQLLLSDNAIVCDCKNSPFIEATQRHHQQVNDYKNLTCAGHREMHIHDVNTIDLCAELEKLALKVSLGVSGALVVLILFAVYISYRYGRSIQIFLYARGWLLCCIQEDELDVERIFDAFVSFAYADEVLVSEELVPELEKLGFKICVHYRDWVPGDLIPTQIVRSVEASRRTIVVLSKNFVNSMWGLLEFRTAHARALKEGIARVIIVVLDDIIDANDLDRDIRSYVRTNTYVQWNDPWLWDKMRYALRHLHDRRINSNNTNESNEIGQFSDVTLQVIDNNADLQP